MEDLVEPFLYPRYITHHSSLRLTDPVAAASEGVIALIVLAVISAELVWQPGRELVLRTAPRADRRNGLLTGHTPQRSFSIR